MKKKIAMTLLCPLLFAAVVLAAPAADALTGLQIADKVESSNISQKGLVTKGVLELKDLASKDTEKRSFVMAGLSENGLKKMLFKFTDSSYKGTAFLSLEKDDREKTIYIFLKSVGSPRQVEASDKENNFVDTDFSNEDLGGSNTAEYVYKRLEDKKSGDLDCYMIEKTPRLKSSKYGKYVVLVDKATFIPVAAKAFSPDGRVIKTIRMDNIKKIADGVFVPYTITVTDVDKKHESTVTVREAVEKDVNRGYFNKNKMDMKLAEE
jgi:outer membrane lipoprotein-sorting protein